MREPDPDPRAAGAAERSGVAGAIEAEILGETGATGFPQGSGPNDPADDPGAARAETRVALTWVRGRQFVAMTESGHSIVCDARESDGGQNSAPQPLELFLTGLGNCSALDVVSILERMRVEIQDLRVHLKAPRLDTMPRVWQEVTLRYELQSPDATPHQVERAVRLSMDTYCSATAMLLATVPIRAEVVLNGTQVAEVLPQRQRVDARSER